MIHPNMATMLGFVATDARVAQPLLEAALREAAGPVVQSHHGRWRHVHQRRVHAGRHGPGRHARDHGVAESGVSRLCRSGDRRCGRTRAGDRARRRRRDQVHHDRSHRRARSRGVRPGRVLDRPLAAREDGVSSPPIRIWAAFSPRSARRASPISIRRASISYLDDVLVAKDGGRNPDYREADGQRVMQAKRDHGAGRAPSRRRRAPRSGPAICRTIT